MRMIPPTMCSQSASQTCALIKSTSASWLVGVFDYIQNYPHLVVNGFHAAGIPQAIDCANNEVLALLTSFFLELNSLAAPSGSYLLHSIAKHVRTW